jgi:hypothetical protein
MAAKDEGLRVDFSSEEADSEALSFDPIPTNSYHVKITNIEDREAGEEAKNPGAPFWNVEMTVQEGEYTDRKVWANVMLFSGALYSLAQLLKATGNAKAIETGKIPAKETFISQDIIAVVKKQRDKYAEKRDDDGVPQWKNEVKGFKAYSEDALKKAGTTGKSTSLMP